MISRDPPHYLKPLLTTTTPKRLMWLSCRGHVTRKGGHYEKHFQAAALGRTWWTDRTKTRKDTLDTFDSASDLWGMVSSHCPVGRRVVLFTFDLAEQLRLSQLLTHLPALGWSIDKVVLEKHAAWCLLRNGKRSLMCCDLQSWCPVEFGKIRADVALAAQSDREFLAGVEEITRPCTGRVAVIREATLQILNWIEGENLGPFRPTGSGQSFSAYRRRFLRTHLLVHDDISRLNAERVAMHTGRAEAWRHGRLSNGPFVEYDLHAAYATIGRDCEVPTVARGHQSKPNVGRVRKAMESFAVLADVTVTTDIECVPYNLNGRTLWPVGTFRTMLWDPELQLALDYAQEVKVHRAWLYARSYAVRDFCGWVLDHMEGQSQVYGLIPQRVLKHWSRCLIGRLGLRYRAWHRFGPLDPPDVRLIEYWDLVDGLKTEMLYGGSQCFVLGEMQESRESLPQIPGWIMSKCRAWLWNAIVTEGENLVYVDTDSVIFKEPHGIGSYGPWPYGVRNGQWTHKGTYSRLTIHGPRNLELGAQRRVAGLPLSARQSAPLEFDGEVMRSVKHSMRNGELDLVVSVPRTFHLNAPDLRRQHNPDGSTSPFRLEEACT